MCVCVCVCVCMFVCEYNIICEFVVRSYAPRLYGYSKRSSLSE